MLESFDKVSTNTTSKQKLIWSVVETELLPMIIHVVCPPDLFPFCPLYCLSFFDLRISDYPFDIFKLFFQHIKVLPSNVSLWFKKLNISENETGVVHRTLCLKLEIRFLYIVKIIHNQTNHEC
jgi:hypothetical protein